MQQPIFINDYASISPLGDLGFAHNNTCIVDNSLGLVAPLQSSDQNRLKDLEAIGKKYAGLDKTVQLALLCARDLKITERETAINIGSSRGATGTWESFYTQFAEHEEVKPQASPLTTLGNVSSWVAQDLGLKGAAFSHSITCATSAHAVLNAIAWINSDMTHQFIAGGTEAPLTPFTIAQMKALRIYADSVSSYPCKALDLAKTNNSMVLGEAAGLLVLGKSAQAANDVKITGYGVSIENINSATGVSENGIGLQESMKKAITNYDLKSIDAIVTHAPGTIKGDQSEYNAIVELFGNNHPALCNNKWQIGHTLGASGVMSLIMGIEMLKSGKLFKTPYLEEQFSNPRNVKSPQRILVNSTGFGGNSVSILLEK